MVKMKLSGMLADNIPKYLLHTNIKHIDPRSAVSLMTLFQFVNILLYQDALDPVVEVPHEVDPAVLALLLALLWQIVIVLGHNIAQALGCRHHWLCSVLFENVICKFM